MAAIPFGFSFGDFVAGIEIIHKAAQALRRSSGVQIRFYQAITDLESIEHVPRRVEALSPSSHPDTIEAARKCAFKCSIPLNHFLHRMVEYEKHLKWPSGSRTTSLKNVVGGYWKIKWALRVEEEFAKLKTDIGPLLEAMNTLLHIETLDHQELTLYDRRQLESSTNHAISQVESSLILLQQQVATSTQVDQLAKSTNDKMQPLQQQVSLLIKHQQIRKMESGVENISQKLSDAPTSSQVSQVEALLQVSVNTQAHHRTRCSATAMRHQRHLDRVEKKVDEVVLQLSALHVPISAGPALTSARHPDNYEEQAWDATAAGNRTGSFDSRPNSVTNNEPRAATSWSSIVDIIRQLLVAVIAMLVQSVPALQAHMLTLATLTIAPLLSTGNIIILTDALNRTKLLPYEYFCDWDMCQAWLKYTFRDMPGETRVKCGAFAMFKQYARSIGPEIKFEDWRRRVLPGDRVVMSVLGKCCSKYTIAC